MKTPSPISKVSRCLKPTPLPTCRPAPQRLRARPGRSPGASARRPCRRRGQSGRRGRRGRRCRNGRAERRPGPPRMPASSLGLAAAVDRRDAPAGVPLGHCDIDVAPDRAGRPPRSGVAVNLREDRQRQHFARRRFGMREIALAIAEIGMRLLQMHRDRDSAGRSARRRPAGALQAVAVARADGVDVIDVAPAGAFRPARCSERMPLSSVVVAAGVGAPRLGPGLEMAQLDRRIAPWMPSMR